MVLASSRSLSRPFRPRYAHRPSCVPYDPYSIEISRSHLATRSVNNDTTTVEVTRSQLCYLHATGNISNLTRMPNALTRQGKSHFCVSIIGIYSHFHR